MLDVAVMAEPLWGEAEDWEGPLAIAVEAAMAATPSRPLIGHALPVEVSIRLADDAEVHQLNAQWRGKDKPTNVLSFPQLDADELTAALSHDVSAGQGELLLGDIILAHETCVREAAEKAVPLVNHATHLVVHGTLHLLGYDHVDEHEAETMEALERQVMATLGYADPYALDGVTFDGE